MMEMMHKIPSSELFKANAFRMRQIAFCILTLLVFGLLLLLHTAFAFQLGEPSTSVILVLGIGFLLKFLEIVWLQHRENKITETSARRETALSIAGIYILAGLLAFLTDRDDNPYFVLLAIPILECAYQFGLVATVATIVSSIAMMFWWTQHFFALHPPPRSTEYLETGMISIIYALIGVLVWLLVDQLNQQQSRLYQSMAALDIAHEQLAAKEKLAAIGRLAGGIAHEIRNPVAMISSSLSTAANQDIGEADREEMVQIAAREASRLEHLTTEFLTYARPLAPRRSSILVNDLLSYTVDSVKAHAASRSIEVRHSCTEDLVINLDSAQVQGALLNLVLNAIDAIDSPGMISLDAALNGVWVQINVQNTGEAIPDADLPRIFEPFYSAKPGGTGLGLAIARRVAEVHGGDLWVSNNQNGRVTFSMTLSTVSAEDRNDESHKEL
ncbi:MAG: ATP-binding protein [Acidobacteriota bacterium]